MDRGSVERFLEFLLIGLVMGTVEDLIAVKLATGATIEPRMIIIIFIVAIPFAAFSELVVDNDELTLLKKPSQFLHNQINKLK